MPPPRTRSTTARLLFHEYCVCFVSMIIMYVLLISMSVMYGLFIVEIITIKIIFSVDVYEMQRSISTSLMFSSLNIINNIMVVIIILLLMYVHSFVRMFSAVFRVQGQGLRV